MSDAGVQAHAEQFPTPTMTCTWWHRVFSCHLPGPQAGFRDAGKQGPKCPMAPSSLNVPDVSCLRGAGSGQGPAGPHRMQHPLQLAGHHLTGTSAVCPGGRDRALRLPMGAQMPRGEQTPQTKHTQSSQVQLKGSFISGLDS